MDKAAALKTLAENGNLSDRQKMFARLLLEADYDPWTVMENVRRIDEASLWLQNTFLDFQRERTSS